MCGGSPLIQNVGEIHRRDEIMYSRSPLSEPVLMFDFCIVLFCSRCRGDTQERRCYVLTLVLPSVFFSWTLFFVFVFF